MGKNIAAEWLFKKCNKVSPTHFCYVDLVKLVMDEYNIVIPLIYILRSVKLHHQTYYGHDTVISQGEET